MKKYKIKNVKLQGQKVIVFSSVANNKCLFYCKINKLKNDGFIVIPTHGVVTITDLHELGYKIRLVKSHLQKVML